MPGLLVIAIAVTLNESRSSDAAGTYPLPAFLTAASENSRGALKAHRGSRCPSAHKAVKFYAGRIAYWRNKMGAPHVQHSRVSARLGCPRYLAQILKGKAVIARIAYYRWHEYHYDWMSWLPQKWQRIGACETGYGRRPGNWQHSNSSYEGAFGFAKRSWDSFKWRADPKAGPYPEDAWQATPRQQYEVALAIYRAYGFSGWGCRGA